VSTVVSEGFICFCRYGGAAAVNLQGSSAHSGINFVGASLF
jgi:hypothetical protein